MISDAEYNQLIHPIIRTEKLNSTWEDIAGLETIKNILKEYVLLPIKFPQLFENYFKSGICILLYGPPGSGKTFLANVCANKAGSSFFSVASSDLISKYLDDSDKIIRNLFEIARKKKPSIILIDDIDLLDDSNSDVIRKLMTELTVQIRAENEGVHIIIVTNAP